MKRLENWRSLEEFGVTFLTAESCGYMLRYLCDLNERGKRIIEAMLDTKLECSENWNSGSVASILLTPFMFTSVATFCLIDEGCEFIWILKDNTVVGLSREERDKYSERSSWNVERIIVSKNPPRNVHQMSGRTA